MQRSITGLPRSSGGTRRGNQQNSPRGGDRKRHDWCELGGVFLLGVDGPCPHLTFHLAGGRDGIGHFLGQFAGPIEGWWQDLGRPRLTPVVKEQIVSGVMAEAIRSIEELAGERDRLLVEILALKGYARIP